MSNERKLTKLPCLLCGMSAMVEQYRERNGSVCVWYNSYMSYEECADSQSSLRKTCVEDGNHFVWKVRGYSPFEHFSWRRASLNWAHERRIARISAIIAVISAAVGVITLILNLLY